MFRRFIRRKPRSWITTTPDALDQAGMAAPETDAEAGLDAPVKAPFDPAAHDHPASSAAASSARGAEDRTVGAPE